MNTLHYQAVVATPGFALGVRCCNDEVTAVEFLEPQAEQAPSTPLAAEAARQLHACLNDPAFEFALPLRPAGTPFQQRVWQALAGIPYGQTRSYGEQAASIGKPTAVRAVGAANGRNPLPIILPCHRVIGRDGSLTGYAGGLTRKAWLLEHERKNQ